MVDELTLKDDFSYSMRFAVIYRLERKKIVQNQVLLATFVIDVLQKLI
jgi:hypothetical protein